ncbi:MAG: hypothetical protein AMK70_01125 [Nitrospira bacterium SG8_35_1]|nr:MAG: hypothetical protein AMK70_01125 [Nitrospira bacterium SG8_35_1]
MPDKQGGKSSEEKRSYFRVDDVISVVVNPVSSYKKKDDQFLESVTSSKAFSLMSPPESSGTHTEESDLMRTEHGKLYEMMGEIKTKLDFIINHFILDREGLLSSDKALVNISASGIRFVTSHAVEVNDVMEVKFLLPSFPPVAVFGYGEVKRVDALGDGKYEVAIEYLNMDESVRNEIIQYTLSHQRETMKRMRQSGSGT